MNKTFDFSNYISAGFKIFGKNGGLYILFVIIFFLISFIAGLIPGLNILAGILVTGVLGAGAYYFIHIQETGGTPQFANFFDGFRLKYADLALNGLFTGLLSLLASAPILSVFGMALWDLVKSNGRDADALESIKEMMMNGTGIGLIALGAILVLLVSAISIFSQANVVFKGQSAWNGIVSSFEQLKGHLPRLLLFLILWGIIMFVSVLPCGLGLLVTIPAFSASIYTAYKDIVGID